MTFFAEWWERYRKRRTREHRRAVGSRFPERPVPHELAAAGGGVRALASGEPADAERRAREEAGAGAPVLARDQAAALRDLLEECAELQYAIAKAMRDGWDARVCAGRKSRRMAVEEELGHVLAALEALYATGELRLKEVRVWKERRLGARHAPPAAAPISHEELRARQ